MSLCKDCTHAGLCVVLQKLKEDTIVEFPDGKVALVAMESALLSCDHHAPIPITSGFMSVEDAEDGAYPLDFGDGRSLPEPPVFEQHSSSPEVAAAGVQYLGREPAIIPDAGEVVTYGPGGAVKSPAGAMPGLFGNEVTASQSSGQRRPRRLSLTNVNGLA